MVVAAAPVAAPVDPNSVSSLTGQLNTFDKTAQNPLDIYNSALDKLGISDARTRVTGYRQALIDNQNLLSALPGNVQQRTANSLVTEAQRQRLVAAEGAPIQEQGGRLNQQFSAAQGDLSDIETQGRTQADLTIQGQSSKRQALMDRLQIAINKAGDSEKKREWQVELNRQKALDAESKREFNVSSSKSSGGGGGGGSYRTTKSTAKTPTYQIRSDKGFNFQNTSGKAISARLYAQLTNTNFNTLLKKMAAAGDKGAQDVLKNGGSSRYYKALTWN